MSSVSDPCTFLSLLFPSQNSEKNKYNNLFYGNDDFSNNSSVVFPPPPMCFFNWNITALQLYYKFVQYILYILSNGILLSHKNE